MARPVRLGGLIVAIPYGDFLPAGAAGVEPLHIHRLPAGAVGGGDDGGSAPVLFFGREPEFKRVNLAFHDDDQAGFSARHGGGDVAGIGGGEVPMAVGIEDETRLVVAHAEAGATGRGRICDGGDVAGEMSGAQALGDQWSAQEGTGQGQHRKQRAAQHDPEGEKRQLVRLEIRARSSLSKDSFDATFDVLNERINSAFLRLVPRQQMIARFGGRE